MRIMAWMAFVLVTLSSAPAAAATGFVDRLPPVDRVIRDYGAGSGMETRVRQAAACNVMSRAVELLMGPRYYRGEWQAGEQALRQSYATCVGNRMPEPSSSTLTRRAITSQFGKVKRDPRFIAEVRGRYLAPQDLSAVERQEAEWNAMLANQQAGYEAERAAATERTDGRKALMFKVLAGCAVALLLGAWGVARGLRPAILDTSVTPARLSVAGRTYPVHATAGIVAADLDRDSRTTHYSGSDSYDQHGNWIGSTPGYSVTNTAQTVFIIDGAGAERALKLWNWDLVARKGHDVAAAWTIEPGKSAETYLRFRNVTLGSSLTATDALERMFRVNPWFLAFLAIGLAPVVFTLTMFGMHRQGALVAAIVAAAIVAVLLWLIRNLTKSRARAFGRDQLSAFVEQAATDARSATDQLLAPYKPA